MIEIRIHGRGGQGSVTSASLLAIASFNDGKFSQAFPTFGPERGGCPVEASARVSDNPINIRSQIYNPDVVIVLDASLIDKVDISSGLKKKGVIIINSGKPAGSFKLNHKTYTIDATKYAIGVFNRPFVNTALLGAFSKITKVVSLNSLLKAVDEHFKGKVAELNKKVIKVVYDAV